MLWFPKTKTDPVCLMKVNKEKTLFKEIYKNREYYFCSENCKEQFAKEPEKFHQDE